MVKLCEEIALCRANKFTKWKTDFRKLWEWASLSCNFRETDNVADSCLFEYRILTFRDLKILSSFHGTESNVIYPKLKTYLSEFMENRK